MKIGIIEGKERWEDIKSDYICIILQKYINRKDK